MDCAVCGLGPVWGIDSFSKRGSVILENSVLGVASENGVDVAVSGRVDAI